ncbi:hypothetical protein Trydic_g1269 [Trypoxylus dichotomus]
MAIKKGQTMNKEKLQTVSDEEEDKDEEDEEENGNDDLRHKEEENSAKGKEDKYLKQKQDIHFINFRDVGDAIRKYDGTDDYPVRRCVEDVEDIGKLVK